MTDPTIQQTFDLALGHHRGGRLREAEQLYRQVLAADPEHFNALHCLGVIAHITGRIDVALDALRKAGAVNPDDPEAQNNLGNALKDNHQLDDAIAAYRRAIELKPDFPDAHYNLGIALTETGQIDDAITAYRRAIDLNPRHALAHDNLGTLLREKRQFEQAIDSYLRALSLKPKSAEIHFNLAIAFGDNGQPTDAIAAYRQAIALRPNFSEAYNNLGVILLNQGRPDEASAAHRRAIALDTNSAEAFSNLGNDLKDQGEIAQAIAAYRRAITLKPTYVQAHGNILYAMLFDPDADDRAIAQEQHRWNSRHADPLRKDIAPHSNERAPDRRLRIGYVSPYFYDQAESFFVVPLLQSHNRKDFEIHCYASVMRPDDVTQRHRTSVDHWHDVLGRTDAELAQQIRDDKIDILIDLAMHMAYNRALLFARKPAPIQVAWLAYPGGTGLDAIDYRITDSFIDPPDADQSIFREQSIRLPDGWCCYNPMSGIPSAIARPSGPIRFGSLNNPCKLNEPTLRLWARVLQAVPDSTLLLQVISELHRQKIRDLFESLGVPSKRIEFVARVHREQYLRLYDQIDIGLDPLPYNGITTTCDALWMGVPVATLTGQTACGRAGVSILHNLGLPELAAKDGDEFVAITASLAADRAKLNELRTSLRGRMQGSSVMDGPRFARNLESAYRQMWRTWCTANRS